MVEQRKRILVFRTVRPELIGFAVKDILEKFGRQNRITVITDPKNAVTIQAIPGVSDVIGFTGNAFTVSEEAEQLERREFDTAVILTSGNLDSYDNVVNFSNKIFGRMPIYYYRFPREFTERKADFFHEACKLLVKMLSAVVSIVLIVFWLIGMNYYFFKDKLSKKEGEA